MNQQKRRRMVTGICFKWMEANNKRETNEEKGGTDAITNEPLNRDSNFLGQSFKFLSTKLTPGEFRPIKLPFSRILLLC